MTRRPAVTVEDQPNSAVAKSLNDQAARMVESNLSVEERVHREKGDYETSQDKFNRRLANATAAIAFFSAAALVVGILQWNALKRTDDTTREALISVQRPFISMAQMNVRGFLAKTGRKIQGGRFRHIGTMGVTRQPTISLSLLPVVNSIGRGWRISETSQNLLLEAIQVRLVRKSATKLVIASLPVIS